MNLEDYVPLSEAAEAIGTSTHYLRLLIRQNDERVRGAFKFGGDRRGYWLVPRSVLDAWYWKDGSTEVDVPEPAK